MTMEITTTGAPKRSKRRPYTKQNRADNLKSEPELQDDNHAEKLRVFTEQLIVGWNDPKLTKKRPQIHAASNLDLLDQQCVYLEKSGRIFDLRHREYVSRKSFSMRGTAHRTWLSHAHDGKRPTVGGLTFQPDAPKIVGRSFNLYDDRVIAKPLMCGPLTAWDTEYLQLFHRLVLNLAEGNVADALHIKLWIAHALRNPGSKSTALVLRGAHGTGKGLLASICRQMFGKYAVGVGHEQIDSRFNGWIGECVLALANEISVAGFADKKAAESKLKALITENTVMVEHKGADAYEIPNCAKWLMMSNENVPLAIGPQDRRYSVVASSWPLTQSDPSLILPLVQATRDPMFIQLVVNYLYSLDLATFDPHVPHKNAARDAVIEDGLTGPALWWHQELPPAGRYPAAVLHARYAAWCDETGEKRMAVADLLRARPEGAKTPTVSANTLTDFARWLPTSAGAKVKCVDIPGTEDEAARATWIANVQNLLRVPVLPPGSISDLNRLLPAGGTVPAIAVRGAGDEAATKSVSQLESLESDKSQETIHILSDVDVSEDGPLLDQVPNRPSRGHSVRRFFTRAAQFTFAALAAFLLAHGVPVLDIANSQMGG